MYLGERHKKILEILKSKKRISVKALAEKLYVCEMTIRRDLKEMENNKILKRYHGGAIYIEQQIDYPLQIRKYLNEDKKKMLGKKAEKYLKNSQTIYLDSSTTCLHIIPYLKNYENIIVVTNSVQVLINLADLHISCILAGGKYYEKDMCLVGNITAETLSKINVDVAFFSAAGLSDDGLITDDASEQTYVRQVIMKNSQNNIFLFDTTKIGKKYRYTLSTRDEVTEVIII